MDSPPTSRQANLGKPARVSIGARQKPAKPLSHRRILPPLLTRVRGAARPRLLPFDTRPRTLTLRTSCPLTRTPPDFVSGVAEHSERPRRPHSPAAPRVRPPGRRQLAEPEPAPPRQRQADPRARSPTLGAGTQPGQREQTPRSSVRSRPPGRAGVQISDSAALLRDTARPSRSQTNAPPPRQDANERPGHRSRRRPTKRGSGRTRRARPANERPRRGASTSELGPASGQGSRPPGPARRPKVDGANPPSSGEPLLLSYLEQPSLLRRRLTARPARPRRGPGPGHRFPGGGSGPFRAPPPPLNRGIRSVRRAEGQVEAWAGKVLRGGVRRTR